MGRRGNQRSVGHVQLGVNLAWPLLMVICVCSCGDSSDAPSALGPSVAGTVPAPTAQAATAERQPEPTDAVSATTVFAIARNDALIASMAPTHVSEPCPGSPGSPDGTEAMQTELAKLEPMLGVVLAYGREHRDEFGSYGLIWKATNDASVFISFTQNLNLHRDALNQLVAHPAELIVCQVALSGDVARALIAKLSDDLNGRFSSVANGIYGVEVVLKPGEEALADELVAEYGDAVNVSVCSHGAACSVAYREEAVGDALPTPSTTRAAQSEPVIDTANGSVFGLTGVALADPDDVIAHIGEFVGEVTLDTGWLRMPVDFVCTGSDSFRTIWWGDLRMTFENGPDGTWLTAWSVGDPSVSSLAPLGAPPPEDDRRPTGLASREGIAIGAPAEDVRAILGDRLYQDDEDRMVVLSGAIVTSILLDQDQRVSAIGSGRTDCINGSTV
jgi:hypothetical protein